MSSRTYQVKRSLGTLQTFRHFRHTSFGLSQSPTRARDVFPGGGGGGKYGVLTGSDEKPPKSLVSARVSVLKVEFKIILLFHSGRIRINEMVDDLRIITGRNEHSQFLCDHSSCLTFLIIAAC